MYEREQLVDLYRAVCRIRAFETRCIKLYRQGLIRGYLHLYLGQEAIAAGVCTALEPRDYIVSTHRGHGHCIARGAALERVAAELLGRATGYCGGRGGSMHIADFGRGNLGANGIVGGGLPMGVGAALASKIRGDDRVTAAFFSDGASNNGVFAECLNLAAAWSLPALFVLENNQYAVSTPVEQVTREPALHKRGLAYGVESLVVDGNDVLEVYARSEEAVARCRRGEGPVLIEARTFRHGGHHVNDPGHYMPREKVEYYRQHDPVTIAVQHLRALAGATEEEVARLTAEVEAEVETAVTLAVGDPAPSPSDFLATVGSAGESPLPGTQAGGPEASTAASAGRRHSTAEAGH